MDGEGDPDPMTGRDRPWVAHLWDRKLHRYPDPRARYGYLAVVVLTTIVLYYQQYVGGAVAPSVLAHFDMSFRFYLTVIVVSSVAGAVASLLAGLADRSAEAIEQSTGVKPKMFITGGDAGMITGTMRTKGEIVPDLVLQGLAVIASQPR